MNNIKIPALRAYIPVEVRESTQQMPEIPGLAAAVLAVEGNEARERDRVLIRGACLSVAWGGQERLQGKGL